MKTKAKRLKMWPAHRPLPSFNSEKQEQDFYQSHDFSQLFDFGEEVKPNPKAAQKKETWIMSCGPIFEGFSRDKRKIKKHVRLCYIGTWQEVIRELGRLQKIAKVFPGLREEGVQLYRVAGVPVSVRLQ